MRNRQAFSGLHQGQHELALHQTRFGHAVGTHIIIEFGLAGDRHRGEVVEHHREVLVNQGAHERGKFAIELVAVLHQHIHGAQQMLMLTNHARVHRQGHCFQPSQHTEFAARVTQAVEPKFPISPNF